MEITVHHTIELSGNAMFAVILIVGVIAFCALYPMVTQYRVTPPELPKEPMGFQPSSK